MYTKCIQKKYLLKYLRINTHCTRKLLFLENFLFCNIKFRYFIKKM